MADSKPPPSNQGLDENLHHSIRASRHEQQAVHIEADVPVKSELQCSAKPTDNVRKISADDNIKRKQTYKNKTSDKLSLKHKVADKYKENENRTKTPGTNCITDFHRQTVRPKQRTLSAHKPIKQEAANDTFVQDFDDVIDSRDKTQDSADEKYLDVTSKCTHPYGNADKRDIGNTLHYNKNRTERNLDIKSVGKPERGDSKSTKFCWDQDKCERSYSTIRNRGSGAFGYAWNTCDGFSTDRQMQDLEMSKRSWDKKYSNKRNEQPEKEYSDYKLCKSTHENITQRQHMTGRSSKYKVEYHNSSRYDDEEEIIYKRNPGGRPTRYNDTELRVNVHKGGNVDNQKRQNPHPSSKYRLRNRHDNATFSIESLKHLREQDPSHIVMTLTNQTTQFKQCMLQSSEDSDLLKHVLYVLAKAFSCNSLSNLVISLFSSTQQVRFFDTVALYLVDLQADMTTDDQEPITQQLRDILKIVWEMTIKSPSSVEIFSRIHVTLGKLIDSLQTSAYPIGDDVLSDFEEYSKHREKISVCQMIPKHQTTSEDRECPPEDYRDIEVFPQKEDIHTDLEPFLRKNKLKGGYIDLNHYLDVQFRLLREDFIGPLREGINEYIEAREEGNMNPRVQDVRVYNNVRVGPCSYDKSGISYRLQFEVTPQLARLNWKTSKRLIYGSLVCLSSDKFNTVYFASVVDREEADITNGRFKVRFEHYRQTVKLLKDGRFTMVETSAYFESYRHVLTAMQKFRPGDLPFENYILQCETQIKAPSYLNKDDVYDLRPLVDEHFVLRADEHLKQFGHVIKGQRELSFSAESQAANNVNVLDSDSWPSAKLLHLDESQFTAIHKAVTKEFAIIQGPPGTGKTYIGLKIAKALLHNKAVWSTNQVTKSKDERPMLIVCYTNHALDQFLEGIIKFFKGDVVRVGGRSKSETLKECNLKHFRESFRGSKNASKALFQGRMQAKKDFDNASDKVHALFEKIEVCKSNVLHERFLQPYIGERAYMSLTAGPQQTKNPCHFKPWFSWIVKWLGLGSLITKGKQETEKNTIQRQPSRITEEEGIDVQDEAAIIQAERRLDNDDNAVGDISRKANHNTLDMESLVFHVTNTGTKPDNVEDVKWQKKIQHRQKLKRDIKNNIAHPDIMSEEEASKHADNVWRLRPKDKWRLYRLWIHRLTFEIRQDIESCEEEFDVSAERYREFDMQEDKEILRQSTVIGMTTTGAARYQAVLQEIGPRIIIVEEAAEVLEAHIIATLSEGCEHLILIGDHKQLKPNPNMYKLAMKFNLNLSLFERMINNGVNYSCLQLQHRMRPQIAELLRDIYPNLQDHDDVKKYADVKGISTNLFLINHNEVETEAEESRSHSNVFEANFAVGLCRYLLLQGYHPEQITILTTYSGQLFCIQNHMVPDIKFVGVKVRVVDNYQGEENDIIILSLVRSNKPGKIGFLKTENRICVALSRAKSGFYIIGNFDLLASNSNLWKSIVSDMKEKNQIGEGLQLYCQNHPNDDAIVPKHGRDFQKAPEGGCSKKCDVRLTCGHVCEMFCHVLDKDHTIYECRKACTIVLCERKHICPKKCFETCSKCKVPITRKIPKCGHDQPVPCHMDPEDYICRDICEKVLPCGHDCPNVCGIPCTKECTILVKKIWLCGHESSVKCFTFDRALCPKPCKAVLSCDHICTGTCGKCFNGRLHKQCSMNCKRLLVCGHECTGKCNDCPPCRQRCANRCKHSKCDHYCGTPCSPCMEPCAWRCRHYKCTRRCGEPCNRPPCNIQCTRILPCKHRCIGLCGEPCPSDCGICDKERVTTILFGNEDRKRSRFVLLEDCRHIVESRALDKYMSMTSLDKDTSILIKLKGCPICTTPIRKSSRYGSLMNMVLHDIEKVKLTILGGPKNIEDGERHIRRKLAVRSKLHYTNKVDLDYELELRLYNENRIYSDRERITLQNQTGFRREVLKLSDSWKRIHGCVDISEDEQDAISFLDDLLTFLRQRRDHFTDQEITDFQREIIRGKMHLTLKQTETCIEKSGKTEEAAEDIKKIKGLLTAYTRFAEESENEITASLKKLRELTRIEGLGIHEDERAMIVKAMSLSKGHWFKCPNNHVYAIGDCGGANQEGECPECKTKIGGIQHRLNVGNVLAPEMDGARYAAYSEEANNMANFQLNDLW